jgi:hypothetical protein
MTKGQRLRYNRAVLTVCRLVVVTPCGTSVRPRLLSKGTGAHWRRRIEMGDDAEDSG